MKTKILEIAQKYKKTCRIHYDTQHNIIIWKGFFKRYNTVYTRSERHQQLKLSYSNINMKISYVRLPDKPGISKKSELYKLPSFVTINGNQFNIIDIIHYSTEKELSYIEEKLIERINENKPIEFEELQENFANILKTILLAYSLFTKFLAFLDKHYKDFYDFIIDYSIEIDKEDIKQFLLDSDELSTIEALTMAMDKALREEDYERASELKKKIETLKKESS